jgi:hypothetical protein
LAGFDNQWAGFDNQWRIQKDSLIDLIMGLQLGACVGKPHLSKTFP